MLARLLLRPVALALLVAGILHPVLVNMEFPLATGFAASTDFVYRARDEHGLLHVLIPVNSEEYTTANTPLALASSMAWARVRAEPVEPENGIVECTLYALEAVDPDNLRILRESPGGNTTTLDMIMVKPVLLAPTSTHDTYIELARAVLPYTTYQELIQQIQLLGESRPCSSGVELDPTRPYIILVDITMEPRLGEGILEITITYGVHAASWTLIAVLTSITLGALVLLVDYRRSPWLYQKLIARRRQ